MYIIYGPPLSKRNYFRKSLFFDEWPKYFDEMAVIPYNVTITGNLNLHVDNKYNVEASMFCNVLDSHGLITEAIH